METTRCDGCPVGSPGRFLGRSSLVGSGPVAEPAVFIEAPGPEGAVRLEADRVIVARGDGGPVGRTGRFLGGSSLVGSGPVAELAVVIPAPGPESGSIVREDDRRRDAVSQGGDEGDKKDQPQQSYYGSPVNGIILPMVDRSCPSLPLGAV